MNTMRTQRVVWPLALLATAFLLGCQEQASSPVEPDGPGPQFSAKKCDLPGGDALPGCGGSSDSDSGEEFEVELTGNYSTSSRQDIDFQENGRRVVVRTEDGAQIDYSVLITLPFHDGSCVWSGLANAAAAVGFWNTFKADAVTLGEGEFRNLLFRVNKKENGFSDGEHRTSARWWIEDAERVMYLVKVGVPGKVLADQLREKLGSFEPAIGTFDDNGDGTKTVTIKGGAIRLSQHNCGAVTGGTAGCGPQAPTVEVACINPTDETGEFTATVRPIEA